MDGPHRQRVQALLADAAAAHAGLLDRVPAPLRASLPVDAQGVTEAIDYLAAAGGLSRSERRALVRPHGVNPAVLHARVFGAAPLTRETIIGAFVDGARVRADALGALADTIGGESLGQEVRRLLVAHPPPIVAGEGGAGGGAGGAAGGGEDAVAALRATYGAHERAALLIATSLDRGR